MKAPQLEQIKISAEILILITELDEFKGRWAATQALAPDRLIALRHIATIESVASSTRIEGVQLTNSEIEDLLRSSKKSLKSRDEQEVAGYAELMETIFTSFQDIHFTENYIKQLHYILLKHSKKDVNHCGSYKKFTNNVEAFGADGKSKGIIFQTATPFDTPQRMSELVEWTTLQIESKKLHPLLILASFIIVFLHIHPFQDGNGRLSRALTTLLLLKMGYSYVSYSSFERIIEENKDSYYLALRRGQIELEKKSSDMSFWFLFFLKSMQKQKKFLESKIKDELLIAKIHPLSVLIIETVKKYGSATISQIVISTKANRNTIKLHLKNLIKTQTLTIEGSGRSTRYHLKK